MFVALAGIDGCGKSTQADRLAEKLRCDGVSVRVFEVWDILKDPELDTGFMGSPEDLRGYLGALESSARCLFIFHALIEATRRARREAADVTLAVGYRAKYAVVEGLLGTPSALTRTLEEALPVPDHTLWLDLDPALAAARKPSFTPYECGGVAPGPEAFAQFQGRCRLALSGRAEAEGWTKVDAGGSESEVTTRLVEAYGDLVVKRTEP